MVDAVNQLQNDSFLLTPLREGRRERDWIWTRRSSYFYSRPCGRGDAKPFAIAMLVPLFLLTPLREGRHTYDEMLYKLDYFYSRPCGRGDVLKINMVL